MRPVTHKPLLLIVEQSDTLRDALRHWLTASLPESRVTAVRSTAGGLRLALARRPHVIVMDPGSDRRGLEPVRQLRAAVPDARIVIFTHRDDSAYRRAAADAGVAGFATKARPAGELLALLHTLLRRL